MAKFQFKLQSVLGLRMRKRDEASQAYEQALLAKQKLLDQIEDLREQHRAQHPYQADSSHGLVDSQRLLESQRYQLHLLQEVKGLQSNLQLVEAECEKRRLRLVDTEKDVRSFEKLREKQRQEWEAENIKREQIAVDQWSGFQYWKKVNVDAPSSPSDQP